MKLKSPLALLSRKHRYHLVKKLIRTLAFTICVGSLGMSVAQAADVYEGFDYADGTPLNPVKNAGFNGQNGGTGFDSGWGGGAGEPSKGVVIADSLTYPGIVSTGNKVENEGSRLFRNLQTPLTSGHTYYISVIIQKDENDADTGYFGLALATPSNLERLLLGRQTGYSNWMIGGGTSVGVRVPAEHPLYDSANPTGLSSDIPIDGSTVLLVAKIEMRDVDAETNPDGLEEITFWVNPDLSAPEDVSTAVGGQAFPSAIDFVSLGRIRVGGGGAGVKHWTDEIRISESTIFTNIAVKQSGTVLPNGSSTTDFGSVQIGSSQSLTYTISNVGTDVLNNLALAFSGTNAADFTASALNVTTLNPGESTTVDVTYTPAALGVGAAVMTISSDDRINSVYDINLTGVCTKIPQEIIFTNPGSRFVSELFPLAGTGGASGNPLTYSVISGPAVVSGGQLRFTGGGQVTIAVNQDGDATYEDAAQSYSFNVVLPKPDVAVGAKTTALVGQNKYAPTKQLVTIPSTQLRAVTGHIGVFNRVTLSDRRAATPISVRGTKGNAFFAVKYTGPGGNLTAKVVAGTYRTAAIDSTNAVVRLRSLVTPNKKKLTKKVGKKTTYLKKTFASTIQVKSVAYPKATDTAKLNVQTK